MKKSVFISIIAACSALFLSCASLPEDEDQNMTGWIDTSSKEIVQKKGIICIKVKPSLGTVNLSVLNSDDKAIPVLSTRNEYTSSALFLKINKKIYKLVGDASVTPTASKNDDGVRVLYHIENAADVTLDLKGIQSVKDRDEDVLKVTVTVVNKGHRKADFAVKQVLDTVLGESARYHFYTSDNTAVKNEVVSRNLKKDRWFTSKNDQAALQLLFDGGNTSATEFFALANYSTIEKNSWEPNMTYLKSFDTVLSYNNSAVCAIWPSVSLMPGESKKIIYYLGFAADSNTAYGANYVYGIPIPKQTEIQVKDPVQIVLEDDSSSENDKNTIVVQDNNPGYQPKASSDVDFDVAKLSRDKYTQEYIQKLLDRISELEKDSASVNREEILQLNKELDEILSAIKE